jgi:hypothetical protein
MEEQQAADMKDGSTAVAPLPVKLLLRRSPIERWADRSSEGRERRSSYGQHRLRRVAVHAETALQGDNPWDVGVESFGPSYFLG